MASRRDCLMAAGGALLGATAVAATAEAARQETHQVAYGHGMVWNTTLPGPAANLLLSFDLRADLNAGTGFGSCSDPVHSNANLHFAVTGAQRHGDKINITGTVIRANDPANIGQPVTISATVHGEATSVIIQIGGLTFLGSGLLVVIAIIAILIG